MQEILCSNENFNKFIKIVFRNNKISQKREKENIVADDYIIIEKTK